METSSGENRGEDFLQRAWDGGSPVNPSAANIPPKQRPEQGFEPSVDVVGIVTRYHHGGLRQGNDADAGSATEVSDGLIVFAARSGTGVVSRTFQPVPVLGGGFFVEKNYGTRI